MQCFAVMNDWMFLVDVNVNSQKNVNPVVWVGHKLTAMFCF